MGKLKLLLPLIFLICIQIPLFVLDKDVFGFVCVVFGIPTTIVVVVGYDYLFSLFKGNEFFYSLAAWIPPLLQLFLLGVFLDWFFGRRIKRDKL